MKECCKGKLNSIKKKRVCTSKIGITYINIACEMNVNYRKEANRVH